MESKNNNWMRYLSYLLIPLILIGAFALYSNNDASKSKKVKYYEIVELFKTDQISEYNLNLSSGTLEYKTKNSDEKKKYTVPSVDIFINDIDSYVKSSDSIQYDYTSGKAGSWLLSLLPTVLLLVALGAYMFFMFRRMNSSVMNENNRTMNFGKVRLNDQEKKSKTTFEDVAGADEEKEELSELVEFLKDPGKYNALGARIPKGVLLVGPPGTGKTLLARAVAGEADAPFFSISGSDFVEMYVGVGASRVRDLFSQAKKHSPSIIFIDEIDAVGRHRGAGMGGGHDEREQTLNQLLVEMDGFGINEGVIVIAATNRPDILDPALLRPGRFDRQVTVGYPDIKGRCDILKVHAKGKPLSPDVDLKVIAQSTVGFTGADLENLLNEAALLAARRGLKAITMKEIEEATIKVVVGTEKRSHKVNEHDKKVTAYHEAGHAISSYYLDSQDPVHQVSIIPRGMAGGYTLNMTREDKLYKSKSSMLDDIVVLLGGRVAEAVIFNDISTGASNDIERASDEARKMVTKYGMSDKLGPITFGTGHDEVFLGKDYNSVRNYSENIAAQIDTEVEKIILDSYERCNKILTSHVDKLHLVAKYLIENEKIDEQDFADLMAGKLVDKNEQTDNTADNAPEVIAQPESNELTED